jgi:hypothetical protein
VLLTLYYSDEVKTLVNKTGNWRYLQVNSTRSKVRLHTDFTGTIIGESRRGLQGLQHPTPFEKKQGKKKQEEENKEKERSCTNIYHQTWWLPISCDINRGLCTPILWFVLNFPIGLIRLNFVRYFCHFIKLDDYLSALRAQNTKTVQQLTWADKLDLCAYVKNDTCRVMSTHGICSAVILLLLSRRRSRSRFVYWIMG